MKIIAFGDIHQRPSNLILIRDEIAKADAVIITGDLTQFGGVSEARPILEELQAINPNILVQAGNLDAPDLENWLDEKGVSMHGRGHIVGDIGIFGCGGGNPSPFNTPNEFNEEEIGEILQTGYEQVKMCPVKFMVPHAPPFNTRVDITRSGLHVGSRSVRDFIEKEEPDICICGNIHEAAGEDLIGKTRIINPGPFFEGGYVVVDYKVYELRAELRDIARSDHDELNITR